MLDIVGTFRVTNEFAKKKKIPGNPSVQEI